MHISAKSRLAAIAVAASFAFTANAADITGAGATFIYPLLSKWSDDYNKATGNKINYQSIGSGGGIAQIKAGTVDFGSSDKPLPPKELAASGLGQFPSAIGGVVPAVNLPGLKAGAMKITVVHRSDGSGTTFNFTNYLSKVSPDWKSRIGEGTAVKWPAGVGGKGNEGVAAYVKQIRGSIGYVELAYALQNNIAYSRMQNAAGNFVNPSSETFAAAAASADWSKAKDFNLVMTNAPGPDAWPIAATNFILMYKKPKDVQRSKQAKEFFRWAYANGDAQAETLHYIPLPDAVVKQIEAYWAANMQF